MVLQLGVEINKTPSSFNNRLVINKPEKCNRRSLLPQIVDSEWFAAKEYFTFSNAMQLEIVSLNCFISIDYSELTFK